MSDNRSKLEVKPLKYNVRYTVGTREFPDLNPTKCNTGFPRSYKEFTWNVSMINLDVSSAKNLLIFPHRDSVIEQSNNW